MIRFFLWSLAVVVLWRLIRTLFFVSAKNRRPPGPQAGSSPISDIEEAEFEDITPEDKPPDSESAPPR